jgi:hypothetical protein
LRKKLLAEAGIEESDADDIDAVEPKKDASKYTTGDFD